MFPVPLFVTARNWNELRCPSVGETVVPPCHGALLSDKKGMSCGRMWYLGRCPGNYTELKKMIPRDSTLSNSIYITFWNDRILETEDGLVVAAGQGQGVGLREGGGYCCKRAAQGISVCFIFVGFWNCTVF